MANAITNAAMLESDRPTAAWAIYQEALRAGVGREVDFA